MSLLTARGLIKTYRMGDVEVHAMTDFGEKTVQSRVELRARYFF